MPANDETRVEELPPDESGGPVPVTHVQAEPNWYGISPRGGAAAVGVAAAGVGIVLLVLGSIVAGAILLAVGALLLGLLVRGPAAAVLSGPTERGRTMVSTRLSAGRRLAALRSELDAIANNPVITFQKQDAARVNALLVATMPARDEREPRVLDPGEALARRNSLPRKSVCRNGRRLPVSGESVMSG